VCTAHIRHNPNNPRRRPTADDPAVIELADSIRSVGVLQPVLVQKIGPFNYELLAGARRFEAAMLAGVADIPAMIHDDLTADQVLDMTVTENLHRADLTPLEEGRGIAMLLQSGRTVEEVSAQIAKSPTWVRRRAKLADLSTDWQAAVEGELAHLSAAHLELVAHLPESAQADLLRNIGNAQMSLKQFRGHVGAMLRDLSEALFDPNTCDGCTKRTDAEPDLFADCTCGKERDQSARCMDEACWKRKEEAAEQKLLATVRNKVKAQPVPISTSFGRECDGTAVQSYRAEHRKVEPGTPGAVPGVYVDGPKRGEVVWMRPEEKNERISDSREAAAPVATLEQKRLHHMITEFNGWLEKRENPPPCLDHVNRLLVTLVTYQASVAPNPDITTPDEFDKAVREVPMNHGKIYQACWRQLRQVMSFYCGEPVHLDDRQRHDLELALHVCGLDIQDFQDAAEKAFPDEAKPKTKKGGKK
jgi:ParB/RepB/Spo0J family partition protein